ncbi:MAG: hypothetical protein R3321_02335 [Nitrososphaeraceae archaeon]|nr:hypothetical protein [Nitrososphaeraceae archaeon]
MILREKIIKKLNEHGLLGYREEMCANQILKLFEKKIDEKIQDLLIEINSVERTQKPNTLFLSYEQLFIEKSLRHLKELKQEIQK